MRQIRDLTPDERNALIVWQQKLSDRTLSKAQHEEAKLGIDQILETGPFGYVAKVDRKLDALTKRVEALEGKQPARYVSPPEDSMDGTNTDAKFYQSNTPPPNQKPDDTANPSPKVKKKGGRGRPAKRFRVDGSRGCWYVVDSKGNPCVLNQDGQIEHLIHKYRKQKDAQAAADRLCDEDPVYSPNAAGQAYRLQNSEDVTEDVEVTEEMPDGGPVESPWDDGLFYEEDDA